MKTVVSMYDNLEDARDVATELVDAGVSRDMISLVARDVGGTYGATLEEGYEASEAEDVGEAAAGTAVGGAVVGGLTGVLVGLGAFAIPGIGPIIAAGPIASGITGAAVGAVTGGILGALVEWGIPEEEAEYYAESIRRGGTLVAARVDDARVEEIVDIMEAYDPVDVERRAAYWRSEEDWAGYDQEADPYGPEEISAYRQRRDSWETEQGTWHDESQWTSGPALREAEEFERFDNDFRRHYDSVFAATGYNYEQYLPAYRYGYNLASDPRYQGRRWEEVEPEARTRWEDFNEGTWQDFKDAVRRGWEQVKEAVGAEDRESYRAADEDDYLRMGAMDEDEYSRFEPSYRRHYESTYVDTDYSYDSYDTAYRYGYGLATYPRYRDYDWTEMEPEARRRWEEGNEGTWEAFKDAVRHGWEEAKRAVS